MSRIAVIYICNFYVHTLMYIMVCDASQLLLCYKAHRRNLFAVTIQAAEKSQP